VALVLVLALAPTGLQTAAGAPQGAPASVRPQLRIQTRLGAITVELFEDSAPLGLAELRSLIGERLYAGATFAYTRPHQEVRLRAVPGAGREDVTVSTQLDAEALGLDRERLRDRGQAMDVLQRELLPAFARSGKRAEPGSPLASWMDAWYRERDPAFLVGATRQAINEALGHRYQRGLASRPPLRGTVALPPASPTRSRPELAFLLADMPGRSGRWMVVGRVTSGLELLESIALRPRAPGARGHKLFEPAEPLPVASVTLAQRSTTQTKPSAEGALSSPRSSRVETRQR
jgi:cyclophilin family peptidyl-prolyl cis-trans isomerase